MYQGCHFPSSSDCRNLKKKKKKFKGEKNPLWFDLKRQKMIFFSVVLGVFLAL
jgi:hypothetical protein